MGDGGHISNAGDMKSGALESADSRLTPAAWTLDIDLHLAQTMFHAFAGGVLSRKLRRIGGALT